MHACLPVRVRVRFVFPRSYFYHLNKTSPQRFPDIRGVALFFDGIEKIVAGQQCR